MRKELQPPAADRPFEVKAVSWIGVFSAMLLSLAHGAQFSGSVISMWAGSGEAGSLIWALWHAVGVVMCSITMYGAIYMPRREARGYQAITVGAGWQVLQAVFLTWFFPVLGAVMLLLLKRRATSDFMRRQETAESENVTPLL